MFGEVSRILRVVSKRDVSCIKGRKDDSRDSKDLASKEISL